LLQKDELVLSQDGLKHPIDKIFKFPAKIKPNLVTIEIPYRKKQTHKLTLTEDHKIFVFNNGIIHQVPAGMLQLTDRVLTPIKMAWNKLSDEDIEKRMGICEVCGERFLKSEKRFCSLKCSYKYRFRENGPHLGNKRSEEARKKMSLSQKQRFKEHPEQHPNRILAKKGHITKFEQEVINWLITNNIKFERQKQIGSHYVDFFIPEHGLIIELDGLYWHQNQETDIDRDKEILRETPFYTMFHIRYGDKRFLSQNLKYNPIPNSYYLGCNPSMQSFVNLTRFKPVPLLSIKKWKYEQKEQNHLLYDLSVSTVHSYVANGILVSNSHQEFGTSRIRGKPYLRPAIIKNINPFLWAIMWALRELSRA